MRISLVTATFNSSKTIRTTLESVANQSWPNIEHIIIDGNSSDNTLLIAKQYNHISIITSEKDDGIYDAMNKGISYATGEIIGLINSDDYFYGNKSIEIVMSKFNNDEYNGDVFVFSKQIDSNDICCYSLNGKSLIQKGWGSHIMPKIIGSGKESMNENKFIEKCIKYGNGPKTNLYVYTPCDVYNVHTHIGMVHVHVV